MDENYKRSIKKAHERQIKKVRSREEHKLLEENSRQRRQGRGKKTNRSKRVRVEEDDFEAIFEKMRPQKQLDLEAAKQAARASPEEPTASEDVDFDLRGTVISVARDRVHLRDEGGHEHEVDLGSTTLGPAVGDEILCRRREGARPLGVRLAARRSMLSRPDPHNHRVERVLAANVDVAVIVASVQRPAFKPALVDRFLIAIEKGGCRPLLCVNKADLLEEPGEREGVAEALRPYLDLGLEVIWTSAESGEGIEALARSLREQTCVFVGHSGVGKSTLLNALDPDGQRDTGHGREFDGKGRHTTTSSELVELEGGTRLIDTPGIRILGLWEVTPGELSNHFPEFVEHSDACRFRDCGHTHEPDCAVRAAVDGGEVSAARYATYLRILDSLKE